MKYISYKENKTTKQNIDTSLETLKDYFDNIYINIDKNIKLDEQQRKIILTDEDFIMVIAGAGSGKTTTITAKVHYLINQKQIKENEIIVITYTNKAVKELQQRINNDFNINIKIMTFHKLGYEIIKQTMPQPPKIINDRENIIKKLIEEEIKKTSNLKTIKIINKLKQAKSRKITKICITIISLIKTKGYDINYLNKIQTKTKREKKTIKFIKKIYEKYEQEQTLHGKIDFDDIINLSTQIIKNKYTLTQKYKYIIIDEYQDISESRYNLIMQLSEKMNSKIMVVGDDWQSIYSFAASNINLFTKINEKIPYCKIMKLEKTYRNSQELINIAGRFIMKNENQITKQLKSNKSNKNPIKIIKYKRNRISVLIKTIEYIIKKYGIKKNILILGRYTFDKNKIIDNDNLKEKNDNITYKNYPSVEIKYMTIHSSKGLGYDNVILIDSENKKLGFPSKKKNNKLIEQLIIEEKNIKYPEERRLMYVALTRTKNEILILTPSKKQSEFIKELKKYKNIEYISNINEITK